MSRLSSFQILGVLTLGVWSLAACNSTDMKGTSERLNPTITREFTQDDYPVASSVHTQGHRGEPGVTDFEQGEWGALDVLVVVDNSGSMIEEQQNLATKLDPLLSKVAKADWRIAVVTTDPGTTILPGGCPILPMSRTVIDKGEANADAKFADAINAGTKGTGIERLFLQGVSGLKCPVSGGGSWVRPESTVVVLYITDEDNCAIDASGYGCTGEDDEFGAYLTDYLASIRTIGTDAKVYGLYKKPGDSACTSALANATRLDQVVTATGGKWGSICDADYTATLEAISEDVAQIVKYEFDLEHTPDDGTLKILVNGSEWTKYTLEDKKVRFSEPPPFGAKVQVSYRHGAAGELNTAFPLEEAPVDGSFEIKVDGEPLTESGYRWNPSTQKLELENPPAERATVEIGYKKKVPLKTFFDIKANDADPLSLSVVVGDKPVKGFKYDAKAGTVTLAEPPEALAKVVISFKRIRD